MGAFAVGSLLVLAVRGHVWIWGVLLAVPIVLVFYSYLYCVCVLIGVVTRSTLAAILLTCLLWFIVLGVHTIESKVLLGAQINDGYESRSLDREIAKEQAELKAATETESPTFRESRVSFRQRKLNSLHERLVANASASDSDNKWHARAYFLATLLPKTTETVDLMRRWLTTASRVGATNSAYDDALTDDDHTPVKYGLTARAFRIEADREAILQARPVSWVIGTSIVFEAVIVSIAAWIFCRRDY